MLHVSSHCPVFIVDVLDKVAKVLLGDDSGPEVRGSLLEFNCFLCQGGYLSHVLCELQHRDGVCGGVFIICHQLLTLSLFGKIFVNREVHVWWLLEVGHNVAVGFVVHFFVFVDVAKKFAEGPAIILAKAFLEINHIVFVDSFNEHPFQ